jgi:hypothetical protein
MESGRRIDPLARQIEVNITKAASKIVNQTILRVARMRERNLSDRAMGICNVSPDSMADNLLETQFNRDPELAEVLTSEKSFPCSSGSI